jgi:hypothetical protein
VGGFTFIRRPDTEKPRQYPKMLTGFFMLSPLSRLLHLE